eukprot:scaffold23821_cov60-Phaeocystis_antarctica.AAC.8
MECRPTIGLDSKILRAAVVPQSFRPNKAFRDVVAAPPVSGSATGRGLGSAQSTALDTARHRGPQ